MRRRAVLPAMVLALACALPAPSAENRGFGLSVVVDRSTAVEYASRGRIYIEALKGRNFTLRLTNPTGERVAVALSVDGRNVVDARRTSAREATKWLLEPWQTLEIPGWQISGETSRRFFFTETASSYAKWLGDTSNVGTIEAVFYRQKHHRVSAQITVTGEAPTVDNRQAKTQAAPEASGDPVTLDAPAGPARQESSSPAPARDREAAKAEAQPRSQADRYAATGIGEGTSFPVQWVDFQEDPTPAASIALRYEFRQELVRLGVLSDDSDLRARDRANGFERRYAPSPGR